MTFQKVAFKNGPVDGLATILGLVLVSCVSASVPPEPAKAQPMTTLIAVTVPDGGWRLRVERVVELDTEVWVLVQLRREPRPAAQMIQQSKAEIPVPLPGKQLRVFVAGKTWAWRNDERYEFVTSLEEVARRAGAARVLYSTTVEK